MTDTRPPFSERRALWAQRLSRLLLADDDEALERFRRQQLRGALHATLDDLRLARTLLEEIARQIETGGADLRRLLDALAPRPEPTALAEPSEEMGVTMVRPQRLDQPAPASSGAPQSNAGPAFFEALSPAVPQRPAPSQAHTMTVAGDVIAQSRMVDRVLSWTIDEWAAITVELEAHPHDEAAIWARRGIDGGPTVYAAIRASWQTRLRDPALRRVFDAAAARYRFLRLVPQRRNG